MENDYKNLKKLEMKRLGDKIKLVRVRENLSQREFANKLGLTQTQITNAEQGKSQKAQNRVIFNLKEAFTLPKGFFEGKTLDALYMLEVLKNIDQHGNASEELFEEIHAQSNLPLQIEEDEASNSSLLAAKNYINTGKYMAIVEGSIAKIRQLKSYLEQTEGKEIDKDTVLKTVDEIYTILSIKDEIM